MISASSLNSKLINKIAQDFAQATGLAVVVNMHGEEISDLFNFTPFCHQQRMGNAREMLQYRDWSIAKNLVFSQTSYFCNVFRQTYNVTPQVFRSLSSEHSEME